MAIHGLEIDDWTLSGFAHEIDPDLNVQCDVLKQLGIGFLEFRSAWDVNVLDLTDQQVDVALRPEHW